MESGDGVAARACTTTTTPNISSSRPASGGQREKPSSVCVDDIKATLFSFLHRPDVFVQKKEASEMGRKRKREKRRKIKTSL
jgi:hypothetical protein